MKKRKIEKKFNFNFIFDKDRERLSSSAILVRGSLLTCIILSFASGVIDIAFFSGLSKSLLHIGTIPMPAAILYTVISVGFISAKFWLAMKLGMLKELRARLTAKQFAWSKNLDKPINRTNFWHKFMIAISIMTALSLSVNSIGSALKDAERNSTNITVSIDELKALKDQKKADNNDKRSLTRDNLEGTATASTKAQENADKYWPIFENWQNKLAQYKADLENETDEEKIVEINTKIKKERQLAFGAATRGIGLTLLSMDDMSPIVLKNLFTRAAKQSETDSESIKAYEKLTNENNEEIKNTILALENLYKHPNEYKDGLVIEGKPVSFLDEAGEPIDITQVIGILQGLREEWKNNSDIGESSQIFMLVSEIITSKLGEDKSSSSGIAEILMILVIAIIGIGQEFLIAHFTPKATIDRSLLRQVSEYLLWENKDQKERFLLEVYDDYYGDGVFNQDAFEHKCKKAVDHLERNIDDTIAKYSKYNKPVEQTKEPKKAKQIKESVSVQTQEEKPVLNDQAIEKPEVAKSEPVKETENQEKFDNELDALIKEAESRLEE